MVSEFDSYCVPRMIDFMPNKPKLSEWLYKDNWTDLDIINALMCVCVCVCVCEWQTDRQTHRDRDRMSMKGLT